jgi:signal transduction histidine kinase/CheY-like chemotaxis protein
MEFGMSPESELEHLVQRTGDLEASIAALRQVSATELDAAERLQRVATQLITAQDSGAVFDQIVDAALAIVHSDFASIQMFYPERGNSGELRLLGHRGFTPETAERWEWVHAATRTACAESLRTSRRVEVPDVRNCDFLSGSGNLEPYLSAGILAVQSTPLISRSGALLGMVSTHWREPHELSPTEQRALDILARLAADIIERSRTEAKLREALEQLEFVTENMDAGVARCSADLRYLWVNHRYAEWLGLPPEVVARRPILDVIGQAGYDEIRPHIENVLAGGREEFEAKVSYRGNDKLVHKLYMPTRGADQKVDGWISVITDVTLVRRAQAESFAREKLESIGMLASGIAHDFNNLLGGVLAQADLALARLAAGASPEEELKAIRDVALRGSDIVRELMIYAGKETAVLRLVDVSSIVQEMLPLFKVSISKHAVLKTLLGKDLPAIRANGAQIRQIILNLVTNASDALCDRDGVIRVTTERVNVDASTAISRDLAQGDYVCLEVSDTGRGMSRETQAKMFEPFFTTKPTGRGIGLAVVQGIVRRLGGAISVTSQPEKGATFQILLPSSGAVIAADNESDSGTEVMTSQSGTVLVVDDEHTLRLAVAKLLRRAGFDVLEAADGVAAVDQLREKRSGIDAILLDATLPGPSTNEIVRCAALAHPDIQVILTSAFSEEMVRSKVSAPQIRGFIRKPFQLEDLVKTLRAALSSR